MLSYQDIKFSKQKRKRNGAYITCATCKKEFYVYQCRLKKGMVKYCSMKCYPKSGTNNPFWGKKHTQETKKRFTENPNRNRLKSGKDNISHIRYTTNFDYYGTTSSWWRYNKRKKSEVCERCGLADIRILQVHHKDRNKNNNNKSNIEIICPNCHSLDHFLAKDGPYKSLNPNSKTRKKGFAKNNPTL